jgi:uncharacterized protein (TIGR02996 family)
MGTMTTEDDFQHALDATIDDWQTRLVFADWLQDRNDPRSVGYYVLGLCQIYPRRAFNTKPGGNQSCYSGSASTCYEWWIRTFADDSGGPANILPWFDHLTGGYQYPENDDERVRSMDYESRRAADEAAVAAFLGLPPGVRSDVIQQAQQLWTTEPHS